MTLQNSPLLSWSSLPSPAKSPPAIPDQWAPVQVGVECHLEDSLVSTGARIWLDGRAERGRQQERAKGRGDALPHSQDPSLLVLNGIRDEQETREAGRAPDWVVRYSDFPASLDCLGFPDFSE